VVIFHSRYGLLIKEKGLDGKAPSLGLETASVKIDPIKKIRDVIFPCLVVVSED